ncbi:MAG: RNA polymerase sigma factor [Tannerellaceae bacterium]|nr:RNA polymerase sigma factor [Tannerellaceae bacterium]
MNARQFQDNLLSIQENMMNFALMLTSNHHDAEDLMQETLLKVLDNKEKFVDNANFKGWVLTIMRNTFINNYHRLVRTHVVDHLPDFDRLDAADCPASESNDQSFRLHELNDAIDRLGDELKVPLSMHLSGYKYAEIAKTLNIPLGTVKSRIFFAKRELQRELCEL